jgi:tetratricopeptide (TPR) repeat protein
VATRIGVLIDLGEFDRAQAVFEEWPSQREGYEFLKWRAVILDEIAGDFGLAASAYEEALSKWPGPFDWRLRNRWANCLTRAGRKSEARQVRREARVIEENMESDVHVELVHALSDLNDTTRLAEVAAFYERLGCLREAEAWYSTIRRLDAMNVQTSVK